MFQLATEELVFRYAMQMVGIPYIFGGNNPVSGFDCSGLYLELQRARGKWPHGADDNAQGIFNHHKKTGWASLVDAQNSPRGAFGAAAFYGSSLLSVTHIGFCLTDTLMIEAGGGDSKVKTLQDAAARNAFVRVRPIKYRGDLLAVLGNY